jgi:large subunit ribosomal protein L29
MADTATDLRDYSDTELDAHIATARKEIFGLRFQNATGELEDTASLPKRRRALARALTVQRERKTRQPASAAAENADG